MEYKEISGQLSDKETRRMVPYGETGLVIPQHLALQMARSAPPTKEHHLYPVWKKQADRLVKFGFPAELGLDEDAYIESLPPFLKRPSNYFDVPLIIDPRVSIRFQMKAAGLESEFRIERIENIVEVPSCPYTIWAHLRWWNMVELTRSQAYFDYERLDNEERDKLTPTLARARQDLEEIEEEGALIELISLALHRSLKGRNRIFALGSRAGLITPCVDEGDTITSFDRLGDHSINMGISAALFTRSPKLNISSIM